VYQSIAISYQFLLLIYMLVSLWLSLSYVEDSDKLVINFLILSAINSGLLHSDNVQPYTDQVKSRSEVSTSSKVLKIELKFMALYHFHS
jgi:hypothetical protein